MSEFKYACPVCSQHIKCDSSQAGTVMECPTCFQKIIAPQAPADADQKLILTGTKVSDRPPQKNPEANPYAARQVKGSSGAVVVIVILAFIGAAVAFVYRGTIFKPQTHAATNTATTSAGVGVNETVAPVVSTASDTNWTLNLATAKISGTNVTGRIHGQDFTALRVVFSNGTLYFRADEHGPMIFGAMINFSGAAPAAFSGKTLTVTTNVNKSARLTLHWKNDGVSGKESFDNGYALRLEFGALTNNQLPGKVYLGAADDEKSYLMGSFIAEIHKSKPKPPGQ